MKAKKTRQRRANFPKISEEMKEWSALLGQELKGWPQVKARPMFGMLGYFRRDKIFAALPVSRGLMSANSFILRSLPFSAELIERARKEPRISTQRGLPGAKWVSFELSEEADLHDALWWLSQAYEAAKK